MKKFLIPFIALIISITLAIPARAQDNNTSTSYFVGKVTQIEGDLSSGMQKVKMSTQNGEVSDVNFVPQSDSRLKVGDQIVAVKVTQDQTDTYYVVDSYRMPSLAILFGIFFVLVVVLTRKKGFLSFAGLALSVLVLTNYLAPNLLKGDNAIIISTIVLIGISFISMIFAHGLNIRTLISIVSMVLTLGLTMVLTFIFINFGSFSGSGSEEAMFLALREGSKIDLRGLLLVGVLIGALGVLDDITTAQAATVEELKRANYSLSVSQLYKRASSVGSEHIASLVNTLVLAYAGASLPLFLLFYLANDRPFWVTLNSEYFAEEIIRTLLGSIALVLAVPITTFIAAWYFTLYPPKEESAIIRA